MFLMFVWHSKDFQLECNGRYQRDWGKKGKNMRFVLEDPVVTLSELIEGDTV